MRRTVKHGLLAAMALAWPLVCSAAAQAEDLLARVKAKGELNVGTEMQFAPFDFVLNGEHAGLNVDLFAEIGKDMGVKIDWIDLPWPSVLPGLEAQKFDMVGGPATVTKARMERYRFSVPVADATVAILKKARQRPRSPSPRTSPARRSARPRPRPSWSSCRSSPRPCPSRSRSRNMSTSTSPMRTSPPAASWPSPTRWPTSPTSRSSARTFAVVEPPFGAKVYFGYIRPQGRRTASR